VVYDWDREKLARRMQRFISDYNTEVHRHKADPKADWPDRIKWSGDLKLNALRGRLGSFEESKIRRSLYRSYSRKWLYFDRLMNERVYGCVEVFCVPTRAICCCIDSQTPFSAQLTDCVPSHAPGGRPGQCFPLSHLKDSAVAQFRQRYSDESIGKEDIFHYIYAILHHPVYRERYAENLKRELPRIPFAPNFEAFADAGKELARLHIDYESLDPWPLEYIERKDVPFSERVTKMKLSKDRNSIQVNESLNLAGIPPEVFEYRLGSKSAIEWVIDQYQVKGESDPNREDDPGYIVRLVGQVVRVSMETVRIVNGLHDFRFNQG
jgi:predicted helicase